MWQTLLLQQTQKSNFRRGSDSYCWVRAFFQFVDEGTAFRSEIRKTDAERTQWQITSEIPEQLLSSIQSNAESLN